VREGGSPRWLKRLRADGSRPRRRNMALIVQGRPKFSRTNKSYAICPNRDHWLTLWGLPGNAKNCPTDQHDLRLGRLKKNEK
jgi:hypothetical protein